MANESLIAMPADLSSPGALRRVISQIIEQLDIALGYRGADTYSTEQALIDATSTLNLAIAELSIAQQQTSTAVVETIETVRRVEVDADAAIAAAIDASELRQLELNWLKGFDVAFIGRSTPGVLTMSRSYNIASGVQTSIGLYTFTLAQDTIASNNILDNLSPSVRWNIAATGTSEVYQVTYDKVSTSVFTLTVTELTIPGAIVEADLYDPDTAGDVVSCAGLFNIVGALPAP